MSKPISFSSYSKYVTCPKMYDLHYNERLRPDTVPAHLIFGSAVDAGVNAMLLETGSPLEAVEQVLQRLVIEKVTFKEKDYDGELIDPLTKQTLLQKLVEFGYQGDDVDGLVKSLFQKTDRSENQQKALTLACATSLKALAKLQLDAFRRDILPELQTTIAVQSKRTLEYRGKPIDIIIDLETELRNQGHVILDVKTASQPYLPDAVLKSVQLALYSAVTGVKKAAFAVLPKRVRKDRIKTCSLCGHDGSASRAKTCDQEDTHGRCHGDWIQTISPKVEAQLLVDEIPDKTREIVIEALMDVQKGIDNEVFPRNLTACDSQYGAPCPYKKYCWSNDSTGLKKEPSNE